jgi:thiamine biosynthesis protein ThiS
MMINGEKFDVNTLAAQDRTLVQLIRHLKLVPERVAIELNGNLVQRTLYDATSLSENDNVEIIHYVGGG